MAPWYKTRRAWAEAALILVATAALVAVVVAACSGNDDSTDPPATSTTVDPDEAAEEEVRQAYRDFLEMAFRVAEAPDPNDPEIAEQSRGRRCEDGSSGPAIGGPGSWCRSREAVRTTSRPSSRPPSRATPQG